MPIFRIEVEGGAPATFVATLGAAQGRARRLSEKGNIWGQSVYLLLLDADGAPQGQYIYCGGGLAGKDLVADWDA